MTPSTITLTFGNTSFSASAESDVWVAQQLDKFLEIAKALPPSTTPAQPGNGMSGNAQGGQNPGTLAAHLKAKGGEVVQVKRFLATADWLRLKGNDKLNTSMVSKALADNQQKRLGNPADSLNQNVGKGFCEKTPDGFYITPDGLKELGYQ